MPAFGAPATPPTDHFAEWFTGREEEQAQLRNILGAAKGTPTPIQVYIGVTGSGKTFLRRRYAEICRAAGVPCLTVELDPDRQGNPTLDRAVLVLQMIHAVGMSAPRSLLALLHLALEESQIGASSDLSTELTSEGVGAVAEALIQQLQSFSVGGLISALAKHGLGLVKRSKDPLHKYLQTPYGQQDAQWFAAKPTTDLLRADLFRRFALDLQEYQNPLRNGKAVQGALLIDSLERASGILGNEHERRRALAWLGDLYASCCLEIDGAMCCPLAVVGFGQNGFEQDWPEGHFRFHFLNGLTWEEADDYMKRRNVPIEKRDEVLRAAEEHDRFHAFSLGLASDLAVQGLGEIAELEAAEGLAPAKALSRRFLKLIGDVESNRLRRLALTSVWDEPAADFALGSEGDPDASATVRAWLMRFSFVQQQKEGEWSLHPLMRRSLVETSSPEQLHRWHLGWAEHWSRRAASATDEMASRAWPHRYARDPETTLSAWEESAETSWAQLRTHDHAALVEMAYPVIASGLLGNPLPDEVTRATRLCRWAAKAQEVVVGDTRSSILRAIGAFETALITFEACGLTDLWAVAQSHLGCALGVLGEREGGSERLEQAVAAFQAALHVYTREGMPMEWAMIQSNLGNALSTLGEREEGTERLEQAVAAFQAALEVRSRKDTPVEWATTQSNLGNALSALGQRQGPEHLEQAVAAFQAALEVRRREDMPVEWATTQNNLGTALGILGEREEGAERLEQAVAAFQAALEVRRREQLPADWATTQNNLGLTLRALGERERSTERLEQAVAAFQAALEVRRREDMPVQWATTQNNLGTALNNLGERERSTERLEQAVAAFQAALEVRRREDMPVQWATTQNNLGTSLRAIGEREEGTERLEQAVAAFQAAFQVFSGAQAGRFAAISLRNWLAVEALIVQRTPEAIAN